MRAILYDFRVSARALIRRRGFTIVAVATLALGIGATTALFSVVEGVLRRPLPYAQSERIVSRWETARDNPKRNGFGSACHVNFPNWKPQAASFRALAVYSGVSYSGNGRGDAP